MYPLIQTFEHLINGGEKLTKENNFDFFYSVKKLNILGALPNVI